MDPTTPTKGSAASEEARAKFDKTQSPQSTLPAEQEHGHQQSTTVLSSTPFSFNDSTSAFPPSDSSFASLAQSKTGYRGFGRPRLSISTQAPLLPVSLASAVTSLTDTALSTVMPSSSEDFSSTSIDPPDTLESTRQGSLPFLREQPVFSYSVTKNSNSDRVEIEAGAPSPRQEDIQKEDSTRITRSATTSDPVFAVPTRPASTINTGPPPPRMFPMPFTSANFTPVSPLTPLPPQDQEELPMVGSDRRPLHESLNKSSGGKASPKRTADISNGTPVMKGLLSNEASRLEEESPSKKYKGSKSADVSSSSSLPPTSATDDTASFKTALTSLDPNASDAESATSIAPASLESATSTLSSVAAPIPSPAPKDKPVDLNTPLTDLPKSEPPKKHSNRGRPKRTPAEAQQQEATQKSSVYESVKRALDATGKKFREAVVKRRGRPRKTPIGGLPTAPVSATEGFMPLLMKEDHGLGDGRKHGLEEQGFSLSEGGQGESQTPQQRVLPKTPVSTTRPSLPSLRRILPNNAAFSAAPLSGGGAHTGYTQFVESPSMSSPMNTSETPIGMSNNFYTIMPRVDPNVTSASPTSAKGKRHFAIPRVQLSRPGSASKNSKTPPHPAYYPPQPIEPSSFQPQFQPSPYLHPYPTTKSYRPIVPLPKEPSSSYEYQNAKQWTTVPPPTKKGVQGGKGGDVLVGMGIPNNEDFSPILEDAV
ncbi:hypothetical protein HDV05_003338 [Chytridiales sp. JEL 0842]|nr:hypothetical protein HDV05_003338 [Chytridiales sp. JEL 0842]